MAKTKTKVTRTVTIEHFYPQPPEALTPEPPPPVESNCTPAILREEARSTKPVARMTKQAREKMGQAMADAFQAGYQDIQRNRKRNRERRRRKLLAEGCDPARVELIISGEVDDHPEAGTYYRNCNW